MAIDKILTRIRTDIQAMKPYVSARSMVQGEADMVFLDANEAPFEPYIGADHLSRYPDQQPEAIQHGLARLYDVSTLNLVATRGADEAIDILVRVMCEPHRDNIIVCPPTFPMYAHSAHLQGAKVLDVPLSAEFALDVEGIKQAATADTKIVFLCSPNNPTGNVMARSAIKDLCIHFADTALVVLDETYIEFSDAASMAPQVESLGNLVVLRTLSKAYAAAGLRCGAAIGQADIIATMRKVLPPYPIPRPVAREVANILKSKNLHRIAEGRKAIIARRDRFIAALENVEGVGYVTPSQANFVLAHVDDADAFAARCRAGGVIIRNQSHQPALRHGVRIAIGSDDDMDRLIAVLNGTYTRKTHDQRRASLVRKTNETAIDVAINLDDPHPIRIHTGVGFYDHMLEQIAKHAGFSLKLECDGDLHIDPHHTIEDCAIALGTALRQALGDKRGIGRYGFVLPMDESQAMVTMDLSGRTYLDFKGDFPESMVGDMPTDLVEHVFRSLAENMQMNLHIKVEGENTHHMVEACFKGFGRCLRQAIHVEGHDLPSSKGVL